MVLSKLLFGISAVAILACFYQLVLVVCRTRGRNTSQCPRCDYQIVCESNRIFSSDTICPECGIPIGNAVSGKKKLRRSELVRIAGLALASMTSFTCAFLLQLGWKAIPTPLLLQLASVSNPDGNAGSELLERLGVKDGVVTQSALSSQELASVARQFATGTWFASPNSDRWRRSFGEYILKTRWTTFHLLHASDWAQGHAVDVREINEAVRIWYQLPPFIQLRTRTQWPEDVPLWISANRTVYWPLPSYLILQVRTSGFDSCTELRPGDAGFIAPITSSGEYNLCFDMTPVQVRSEEENDQIPTLDTLHFQVQRASLRCRIGGKLADAMHPVTSDEIELRLRDMVYTIGMGGSVDVGFSQVRGGAAEGLAFGLILNFYRDGVRVAMEKIWWDGSGREEDGCGYERQMIGDSTSEGGGPWHARSNKHWEIRVEADAATALRVLDREKYWDGRFEMPLRIDR